MHAKAVWAMWAVAGSLALAGCVWPGEVDPTVVGRYERAMAGRAPQPRVGEAGLDLVRPAAQTVSPPLRVTKDSKTGKTQVSLSLDDTIMRALANNLDIQIVSFDPAMAREDLIEAAAQFDYVVFGGYSHQQIFANPGTPTSPSQTVMDTGQIGIKQTTVLGTQWDATWAWTRTWDNSSSFFSPFSPRYEPTMKVELTQPLLRDFGPEVNLARFRIAALNEKVTLSQFRQKVEETLNTVISTYWSLVQARRDLRIQEDLLKVTQDTLDRVIARKDLDATAVQIKQSEAAVESRRAGVIQAHKAVWDAQDQLARLLADKQINVLGDYEVLPTTEPISIKVRVDTTDQLVTALRSNPQLEQARIAIQAADITVRVAMNQTLPRLDLKASAGQEGLGQSPNSAWEDFEHFSYSVGLSLEYPIGNRERLAELQKQRFQRLKAIATMQNVADQIAVVVKERIRQIDTTFEAMLAQHKAVEAAGLQLQALEDTERIRGRLTPEFLQLKLQAQETLATAERQELEAMVNYNMAMADLARVTGTALNMHGVQIAMPAVLGEPPWPNRDHANPDGTYAPQTGEATRPAGETTRPAGETTRPTVRTGEMSRPASAPDTLPRP